MRTSNKFFLNNHSYSVIDIPLYAPISFASKYIITSFNIFDWHIPSCCCDKCITFETRVTEVNTSPTLFPCILRHLVHYLKLLENQSLDNRTESQSIDLPERLVLVLEAFYFVNDRLLKKRIVLICCDEVIGSRVCVNCINPMLLGERRVVVHNGEHRGTHLQLLPLNLRKLIRLISIEDVSLSSTDFLLVIGTKEFNLAAVRECIDKL